MVYVINEYNDDKTRANQSPATIKTDGKNKKIAKITVFNSTTKLKNVIRIISEKTRRMTKIKRITPNTSEKNLKSLKKRLSLSCGFK